jgi:hypothetical protein
MTIYLPGDDQRKAALRTFQREFDASMQKTLSTFVVWLLLLALAGSIAMAVAFFIGL